MANFTLGVLLDAIKNDDLTTIRQNMVTILKRGFNKDTRVVKMIEMRMPDEGDDDPLYLRDFYVNFLG